MGASGIESLGAEARSTLESATFVAGGKRHLELLGPRPVETFAITSNLDALAARLDSRGANERCVVLASGDPLCFGIGRLLSERLDPAELRIEPAVSSMQLAFARAGCAWDDAAIASVHGRPLAETLIPLLGHPKIGLFTRDGESPGEIAEFFLGRGLDDYEVWVCEALGTAEELVTRLAIGELPGIPFAPLNFVVLRRTGAANLSVGDWAFDNPTPPDDQFAQPPAGPRLLTHADVRAVALSRFHSLPEGPLWDVGAGLGGMTIGLARRFRRLEVVAVERSAVQIAFLRENRRRFEAWNVRIIEGSAPEALRAEAAPAGVFLGGSGGALGPILDLVIDRLLPGGVLVANFVGLENLAEMLARLRQTGWTAEVTQVQISQGQGLAGLTTFVPLRPVWVVRARRLSTSEG
jgi:precorrin-6Y C5,15-methyltransferase (decarboxylating)